MRSQHFWRRNNLDARANNALNICGDCGARVHGHKCENCGEFVKLSTYGFSVSKTRGGGYLLMENEAPIFTFKSTGSKTVGDLLERTGAPREIIERELALLVSSKPHVEESEEEEEEILVKYRPSITTLEFIAEQIWDGKTAPRYVVKRFDGHDFTYEHEISLGESDDKGRDIIYRPVYNDHLTSGMVTIPQNPVETSFGELIPEVFDYLGQTDFFDPCGKEEHVKLGGLIAMGSWFIDRMIPKTSMPVAGFGRFAPLLAIRGLSETGKNRLANMYRFISYRPIFVESTYRIPSLFRPLDLWKGTLVMDEADFYKSGPQASITQFLNCRATGTPIPRQNPDKVAESQVFESFGITILTQRLHFDDNATESRTVPYYTERTAHKIPTIELDEVVEWGLRLQNKLLYLRLMYWNQFEIDKRYWVPGISDHRLNAALLPTVSLTKFEPKILGIIEKCIAPIERAKRRVKANSTDGRLINFLWEKLDAGLSKLYGGKFYCVLNAIDVETKEDEVIETPVPLIATKIKAVTGIPFKTIRKSLNSLGMTPEEAPVKARIGKYSQRPIWFIPDKLEKHLREFVIDYKKNQLYKKNGITVPDVPEVPRITPPMTLRAYYENNPMGGIDVEHVEHVEQLANNLIKQIKASKQVGEYWPIMWLKDHGLEIEKGEYLLRGLLEVGSLTQIETGEWSAP